MARSRVRLLTRQAQREVWASASSCWAPRHVGLTRRAPDLSFGRTSCKRNLHIPTALAPPAIFVGLFITLWCWKCTMLVLFQNTIIYNPFLPPNARSLKISDYAKQCGGIVWREETIKSLDGTQLALCVSEVDTPIAKVPKIPVYILYMQGTAREGEPCMDLGLADMCQATHRRYLPDCRIYLRFCARFRPQAKHFSSRWSVSATADTGSHTTDRRRRASIRIQKQLSVGSPPYMPRRAATALVASQ